MYALRHPLLTFLLVVLAGSTLWSDELEDFRTSLQLSTAESRMAALNRLVQGAQADQLRQFQKIVEELENRELRVEVSGLIAARLAFFDAPAAIAIMEKEGMDVAAGQRVLQSWSLREPEAAIAWLKAHPERFPGVYEDTFFKLFLSFALTNFTGAANYSLQLPDEFQFRCTIVYALIGAHMANRASLDQWIDPPSLREKTSPGRIDFLLQTYVGLLTQRSRSEALSWIEKSSIAPEEKKRLQIHSVEAWARFDSQAASVWVGEHSGSAEGNEWIAAYCRGIAAEAPETAWQWAGHLTDPDLQKATQRSICEKWAANNASAALAWIEEQKLSDAAELRQLVEKTRATASDRRSRTIALGPISFQVSE